MPGESGIFQHILDFQRLDDHRLIIVNDLSRQLVLEVIAGVGYPLVRFGNKQAGFSPIGAAFLLARQRLLFSLKVPLRLLEKTRIGSLATA